MTDLNQQKNLTGGKGWKNVLVELIMVKQKKNKLRLKLRTSWVALKQLPQLLRKRLKKTRQQLLKTI